MTKTTQITDTPDIDAAIDVALVASHTFETVLIQLKAALRGGPGVGDEYLQRLAELGLTFQGASGQRMLVSFDAPDPDAEFARRLEAGDVRTGARLEGEALNELRSAASERATAEARVARAVAAAREGGSSWTAIGVAIGTSGEAARQRYGKVQAGTSSEQ